jgi:succinate-semialdehyde dehydrogenase/glutarate-semialdehyde dehydrogenase
MLTVTDPTTGKQLHEVAAATPEQVEDILARADTAYKSWRTRSFSERAKVLLTVAQKMRDDIERLAILMTEEMGKPIKEARAEVLKSAVCAEHYAEHAEQYLASETIASDATHSYVQYLPVGVILGILPWNAPFWLAFRYGAPTLMAGNTCVMKHDPHVPACAQAIAELFEQSGAPADIFQNLPLETPAVESVIRDRRIQAVSFTGSEKGGAAVASIAASEIKHSVLELGGSDPCIVLADANLDEAADIITLSRTINAGQSCIAAKRIIVEAPVYDALVEKLHERMARLTLGDPREESTDIGPIARADLRDNLHQQVSNSIKAGARCLLGGELPSGPGFFYPVTLLADVTEDMTVSCEETFGPVAVVMKAENEEQAIAIANNTPYGLAAGVWTDAKRGETMARRIEAGQIAVNGIVKTDPRLPSGGIKRSGMGRELGPHGIREFVNAQQVWIGPKQGS